VAHGWRLLLALILLAIVSPAYGQQVDATVDSTRVTPGEPLTLSIQVTGGSARTPDVPQIPDCRVQFAGREESFSLVNSSFTRSVTFNFMLTPLREGTLTIPAIPVQVDGRKLSTRPIQVQVARGGYGGAPGGYGGAPGGYGGAPGGYGGAPGGGQDTGQGDVGGGEDVFVEGELEPRQVFVGQQVRQTLKIYTGVQQAEPAQVGRRPVPGTIDEQLPDAIQRRYSANVNGRTYRVEEVTWVFYPVTAGPLQIPTIDVTVPVIVERAPRRSRRSLNPLFDDFFGSMRQVVPKGFRTEEQTLQVLPLPKDGRPADFSGLVGRYAVNAELSDTQLALGDSATLTLTVQGEGNVRDLALPAISSPDFKIYDDSPTVEVGDNNGRILSQKVFKRAIVPQRSGEIIIPAMIIAYFDPELRRYEHMSTLPFKLAVAPGAGGQTQTAQAGSTTAQPPRQAVRITGEDILPIHTGAGLEADHSMRITSPRAVGMMAFPACLFAMAGLIRRQRERQNADPVMRRRRQALRVALAGLGELDRDRAADARTQLDRLSRLFRGYLGDKLSLEGAALTYDEARTRLEQAGVPAPLAAEAGRLIEQIEQARYAPGGGGSSLEALKPGARALLQRLEKELG
jgi:hypothetical protein